MHSLWLAISINSLKITDMIGAIIGDIAGSRFEFNNYRSTDFDLFGEGCNYTDDTIMTVAVADAILNNKPFGETLRFYGNHYTCPLGGYGFLFCHWLVSPNPQPYNSFGNGSAMRVSPCAMVAKGNREKALTLAARSAMPTHNHPEGLKGALATTDAILMAFDKLPKAEIRKRIESIYGYNLDFSCDDIRQHTVHDETCQVTVPQAFVAFLESSDFESAIKLAVSIGGDSDTIAAICGGIAEAYYGIPQQLKIKATNMLPVDFRKIIAKMYTL